MKKIVMLLVSALSLLALNGCGGGGDNETYYLQTYDIDTDTYVGVESVYYECGTDRAGYTDRYGAFTMDHGDYCVLYDLDETLSYEDDTLYIGADARGRDAIINLRYDCDSGNNGFTDDFGAFIFDPTYINNVNPGDICGFDF